MKRLLAGAMLSALASPLQAGWTVDFFNASPLEGYETSIVSTGRDLQDLCVSISFVPILFNDFRAEVWCLLPEPFGQYRQWTVLNRVVTTPATPSVSADTIRGDEGRVRWVASDPSHGDIWYGIGGETPELVSTNTPAASVSLSHFSDGTPFITYSGLNDHVYYATRDGGWTTFQLTNNVTTPNLRTVASVIMRDVVHVVYWDQTYSAVRYGTAAKGGSWKFETVHASPGVPLRPTIAADGEGRARVAFAHPDGKVHVFTRNADGWTSETIDPSPNVAIGHREVALQVDRRGALHVAFSASNGSTALILYARKPPGGTWGEVETVHHQSGNQPDGFYGLSLALQERSITVVPHVSYAYDVFLGLLGRAYRTND